jgi:ribosomal-protein-alanine N-acetyltransferase
MGLFDRFLIPEKRGTERGFGLMIRPPTADDFAEWAALRSASRKFLTPWEPRWPEDDLTRPAYRRRYFHDSDPDFLHPYFIFDEKSGVLMGGISFGHVRRGIAQSAMMGYWMGERFSGQGIMTRAVPLALRQAFGPLGFRRIEAGCIPRNAASIRVLENNQFVREGYAREYLCIAGVWEDHILYARLKTDTGPSFTHNQTA